MTYRDLFNFKDGTLFKYRGKDAKKIWSFYSKELVAKGDPSAKPPTGDVFAEDFCVFFQHKGSREGTTIVFKFLDLAIPVSEGFESAEVNRFTPEYDRISNSFPVYG